MPPCARSARRQHSLASEGRPAIGGNSHAFECPCQLERAPTVSLCSVESSRIAAAVERGVREETKGCLDRGGVEGCCTACYAQGRRQKTVKRSRDNAVVSAVGDIVATNTERAKEPLLESKKPRSVCSSAVGDVVAAGPLVRHDDATSTTYQTPSIPQFENVGDGASSLLAASTLSLAVGSSVCLAALAKPEVASQEPRFSRGRSFQCRLQGGG